MSEWQRLPSKLTERNDIDEGEKGKNVVERWRTALVQEAHISIYPPIHGSASTCHDSRAGDVRS
jgi:hypothetical protein